MTTPHPAITSSNDLLAAVQTSGLLAPAQLARASAALPADAATAARAAQFLVATGFLTRFQAERLLAGRTDGFVFGQYAILEQVGRGSVGRVYKAKHRAMNRSVAIKVLASEVTRTEAARQGFHREVRAAAKLNHPNIVTAFDANEVGERFYLVMEFVDGPTFDALVRERGPLPVGEACELVRQAAVGLQHAHEQGMVHRDIKPHNLLVAQASKSHPGCIVKIADFGIARLAPPVTKPHAAATPGLLGTPEYVAPEQAHNPAVADHRADLYSLGCVFYFLLTGRPPFPRGTKDETILRHQFEAPIPVERVRHDIPPTVGEIVARLLAKDPNARFQSAAAIAARLDGLAAGAVAVGDDGAVVSFDLPPAQPGSYSFTSGYLTGMHQAPAPAADTSPWSQLTDEVMSDAPTFGADLELTPVCSPITRRVPVRAAKPRRGRAWGFTGIAAAVALGLVLLGFALKWMK